MIEREIVMKPENCRTRKAFGVVLRAPVYVIPAGYKFLVKPAFPYYASTMLPIGVSTPLISPEFVATTGSFIEIWLPEGFIFMNLIL